MQRTEKKEHTTFCVDLTQSTPLPSKRHFSRVPGLIANHLSTWTAMAIWTNLPLRDSPISKPFMWSLNHRTRDGVVSWYVSALILWTKSSQRLIQLSPRISFYGTSDSAPLPVAMGGADPLRRRRQWIETAAYCTRLTLSKFYPLLLGRVKLIKPNFNSDPETNRTKWRVSDLCDSDSIWSFFFLLSLSPSLSLSANHGW